MGIAPGASHDEVRRAYTQRALLVHPDRLVDADSDHREAAQLKMAELNAAWEVLRDPARRAEYDRRGAGRGPRPETVGWPGTGSPVSGSAVRGSPLIEPELEEVVPAVARRPGWQAHPVQVIVVVLVLLGFVVALAATGGRQEPEGVDTTERFAPGSCVQVTTTPGLVEVACEEPGALAVLGSEPFPRPCPSGSQAVVLLEEQRSVCVRAQRP